MHDILKKFDPVVDKRILVAISGGLWSAVGLMLCNLAVKWLSVPNLEYALWYATSGIALSLMIHHFGFLKLVNKNIDRIQSKQGKVCIFGFQPWKSYLIILVMIGMGTILRGSSLPKHYLSIIYIGFGGAMLLSSIRYHRMFIKLLFFS